MHIPASTHFVWSVDNPEYRFAVHRGAGQFMPGPTGLWLTDRVLRCGHSGKHIQDPGLLKDWPLESPAVVGHRTSLIIPSANLDPGHVPGR